MFLLAVGGALVLTLVVGPILHRLTVPFLETCGQLVLQHAFQHVRPVAVSAAWAVGCVGALIGLAQRT